MSDQSVADQPEFRDREKKRLVPPVLTPIRRMIWVLQAAFVHPISKHYWSRNQRKQMLHVIQYHPDCENKAVAERLLSQPTSVYIHFVSRKLIRDLVNTVWQQTIEEESLEERIKRLSAASGDSSWPELPSVDDLVTCGALGPSLDPQVTRALVTILGKVPFQSIVFEGTSVEKPIVIEVASDNDAEVVLSSIRAVKSPNYTQWWL